MTVTVDLRERDEPYAFADVTVPVGSRLLVRVRELPASGYRWDVEALPDGLAFVDGGPDEYECGRAGADGPVGGAVTRTLAFVVAGPVRGTLRVRCHRSWEYGAPPSRRAYVRVSAA